MMFRIGAVNCDANEAICNKQKVTEFPTFKLYPPFPAPIIDFPKDEDFTADKAKKMGAKYINSRVVEIT